MPRPAVCGQQAASPDAAQKKAEDAIDTAFNGLKPKLRRMRTRSLEKQIKEQGLRATGT